MLYVNDIDNNEDILDTRDIASHMAELEERVVECTCGPMPVGVYGHYVFCDTLDEEVNIDPLDPDEEEELRILMALREEVSYNAGEDWEDGVTLIRDSHFTDYAQQLAEEVCDMQSASQWPFYAIDWERAARDLRMDYSPVDFDGVQYWARA